MAAFSAEHIADGSDRSFCATSFGRFGDSGTDSFSKLLETAADQINFTQQLWVGNRFFRLGLGRHPLDPLD